MFPVLTVFQVGTILAVVSRLFIIGSGPSLRETPLHLLTGEESWGMGRINKVYWRTPWRPTRVFWSDNIREETLPDVLEHLDEGYDFYCRGMVSGALDGSYVSGPLGRSPWVIVPIYHHGPPDRVKIPPAWAIDRHPLSYRPPDSLPSRIHNYEFCNEHSMNNVMKLPGHRPTSWRSDVNGGYCRFGGTFQVALMHAVEEGYNPIYVVAADLGFTAGGMGDHRNHFTDDYQVIEYDEFKATGKNRAMAIAHSRAREYAEERGIKIYNAGMGGSLEAYERVDFNSLF